MKLNITVYLSLLLVWITGIEAQFIIALLIGEVAELEISALAVYLSTETLGVEAVSGTIAGEAFSLVGEEAAATVPTLSIEQTGATATELTWSVNGIFHSIDVAEELGVPYEIDGEAVIAAGVDFEQVTASFPVGESGASRIGSGLFTPRWVTASLADSGATLPFSTLTNAVASA